jgi:DNA-binding LacI/PurR family transcriptional regulator
LKVGDKLETQSELVKRYDVSLITIKRALSDLISEGVLYARAGKGTYVAQRPQKIDYSKHLTIAYVLKDLDNPFYQSIVSSVERNLSKNDSNLMLYSSDNRHDNEERKIRYFIDMGVSGLILGSLFHSHYTDSLIKQLEAERFPFVMVSYTEDPSINFVGTDQELGGFMATEHLIKNGYADIGYVNGEEGNLVGEARKRGFLKAMTDYDVPVDQKNLLQITVDGKRDDMKSGYLVGKQFCELKDRPKAMFIYNDLSALGFIQALGESGINVPKDVAIVGFDDIANGRTASVPLTTIHQPTELIGQIAVESLLKKISGEAPSMHKLLEPKLIVRKSCCNN